MKPRTEVHHGGAEAMTRERLRAIRSERNPTNEWDTYRCLRCGWKCPHVECGGIWFCPDCGPAISVDADTCTYQFLQGCKYCPPGTSLAPDHWCAL